MKQLFVLLLFVSLFAIGTYQSAQAQVLKVSNQYENFYEFTGTLTGVTTVTSSAITPFGVGKCKLYYSIKLSDTPKHTVVMYGSYSNVFKVGEVDSLEAFCSSRTALTALNDTSNKFGNGYLPYPYYFIQHRGISGNNTAGSTFKDKFYFRKE